MKAAPEGAAMATRRRLKRPDFEDENRAIWLYPDHLSKDENGRLSKYLPVKMSGSVRAEFMANVAVTVQVAKWQRKTETERALRDQFQLVSEKSRELLKALALIHPNGWGIIRAFSQDMAFNADPIPSLSDTTKKTIFESKFLPHVWDSTQDVENIFAHAASQLHPNKQSRPIVRNARTFVAEIVKIYARLVGTWPPYSKDTWFPFFIDELGEIATLGNIGRDIVESVVKDLKHQV